MRSLAPLGAIAALAGCAYFNGIYNARVAERHGDNLRRSGHIAAADSLYLAAARSAESVLVQHPRTHWRSNAQLIAGWSWTMARRCDRAEPHLVAVLTQSNVHAQQLARATLALGICRIREGRFAEGRTLLAPLTGDPHGDVAREAALWSAVASIELRDDDSGAAYRRELHGANAEWRLVRLLVERNALAPAESLLERRAARGDFRPEALDVLRALWDGGRRTGVARLVALYDVSGARADDRARIQLALGALAEAAGENATAERAFATARRLARDPVLAHDAVIRLTAVTLRESATVADASAVIARGRLHDDGPELRRLDDALLLLHMLRDADDGSGAGRFLAAEVARDSLGAPALARTLYDEAAALPRSAVGAMALRAAARLPASADTAMSADLSRRATTASAAYGEVTLDGGAPPTPGTDPVAVLLERTWRRVVIRYADSLRRARPGGAREAGAIAPVSSPDAGANTPPAPVTRP